MTGLSLQVDNPIPFLESRTDRMLATLDLQLKSLSHFVSIFASGSSASIKCMTLVTSFKDRKSFYTLLYCLPPVFLLWSTLKTLLFGSRRKPNKHTAADYELNWQLLIFLGFMVTLICWSLYLIIFAASQFEYNAQYSYFQIIPHRACTLQCKTKSNLFSKRSSKQGTGVSQIDYSSQSFLLIACNSPDCTKRKHTFG